MFYVGDYINLSYTPITSLIKAHIIKTHDIDIYSKRLKIDTIYILHKLLNSHKNWSYDSIEHII
jgi:hypothetical protein